MIVELELTPEELETAQRLADDRFDGDLSALIEALLLQESVRQGQRG